jgi:hypothetical protein
MLRVTLFQPIRLKKNLNMKNILFLSFTLIILSACTANGQLGKIKGSGNIKKETRNATNFKGVSLSGSMDVTVYKGNDFKVVVEADDNLLEYIETVVENDVLKVRAKTPKISWISSSSIKVYVTLPELKKASVSGSGNLRSEDLFSTSGDFSVSVSGSGNCRLNIKAQKLDAHISGSGNIHIAGTTDNSTVGISGSGNFRGLDMTTKDASFRISGSGGAESTVNGNLDAHISGSGGVRYKGNASITAKTSGSGRVSRI